MMFCPDCRGPLESSRRVFPVGWGGYAYIDILYCPRCLSDRKRDLDEVPSLPSYIVREDPLVYDLQKSGDLIIVDKGGGELEVVVL